MALLHRYLREDGERSGFQIRRIPGVRQMKLHRARFLRKLNRCEVAPATREMRQAD